MVFNSSYKPLVPIVEVKQPKKGSRLKERARERREKKESESLSRPDNASEKSDIKTPLIFDEPDIVAISQVSRFHSATLETLAKEVDLTNVNITVQDHEILSDSKLLIKACTRYGLVGRNGVGKSTLLKVIADGTLIGLPANLKVLAVEQIPESVSGQKVIDAVLSADKQAVRTVKESKALAGMVTDIQEGQNSIKKESDEQVNRVVAELLSQRAYDHMLDAQKIATHRSGKRGSEARTVALDAEKSYAEFLELLKEENKDKLNKSITTEMVNDLVAEVFEKLALVDISGSEARARKILKGLGFTEEKIDGEVNKLSGGWRMRAALAQALFFQPDLLLLDEPTNHLDLPAIKWLKKYLVDEFPSESSIVVISHDRAFLNEVAEEIIIFKNKKLEYFPGNYDNYEEVTSDLKKKKERLHASIERRRKHYESSINKAIAHAKSSGDDKRLGMVASRRTRLEKMGMNKTEDGKKFKQSYRAGFHSDYRPQVVLEKEEKAIHLPIPEPEPLRTPGTLVHMENVTFAYSEGPQIVSGVTLNIQPNTRIALAGMNGSGKSTVLGLLQGELTPKSGKITRHSTAQVGYFAQHHVEILSTLSVSALEYLIDHHPGLTEPEARQWLGTYGLSGRLATTAVAKLSGGQKARVILTDILLEGPHLLILDEVTNHLDIASIEALAISLNEFEGAVVCVSHDQWFLNSIASETLMMKNGKLVTKVLKKPRK